MSMATDAAKRAAAQKAVDLVTSSMTLGLGTGSTANHFIQLLGEKTRNGLFVQGVATSKETENLALANGIDLITPDETTRLDLAVDGADEIDQRLNLIKGGGAALLREKIIAHAATKFVVIADASKDVTTLGAFALPVEIEPFGWALTIQAVRKLLHDHGFSGASIALRPGRAGMLHTDGGNYILDCRLGRIDDPATLDTALRAVPGVVETGLFVGMADLVIFGHDDGTTTARSPAG